MKSLSIGQVASRTGVGIDTVRFYEREGLLQEPERRPSGYRQYDVSTVERLEYIRRAKELGFTLAEIRELLELSFVNHTCCDHVRQRADTKITEIEERIRSLQQMKRALGKIVQQCRAKNSADHCPLVHTTKKRTRG